VWDLARLYEGVGGGGSSRLLVAALVVSASLLMGVDRPIDSGWLAGAIASFGLFAKPLGFALLARVKRTRGASRVLRCVCRRRSRCCCIE